MMDLTAKLHPSRLPGMSGLMAGIIGLILGEEWSDPPIHTLSVTTDGHVSTESSMLAATDLDRNIASLLDAVELDPAERREFARLYRANVDDTRIWPPFRAVLPAWLADAEKAGS
jgi:hypothetical protein